VASPLLAAAAVRLFPAAQPTHPACPADGWYAPLAHAVHAVPSVLLAALPLRNLPAAQATHAICATACWYIPLPHAVHAVPSGLAAIWPLRCWPAGQPAQLVRAALGWNWPDEHTAHTVFQLPALAFACPAGHAAQLPPEVADAPTRALPAEQAWIAVHAVAPPAANWPA
jgi:hypothetical protein